jgi:hypothetical protein
MDRDPPLDRIQRRVNRLIVMTAVLMVLTTVNLLVMVFRQH